MLREAIEARRRERGGRYSIRQMAEEAECDHSYISLVLSGKRQPSPEVLASFARVLAPYFPLDRALLAADHAPRDARRRRRFDRILEIGEDVEREIDALLERYSRKPPRRVGKRQRTEDHAPDTDTTAER